MNLKIFYDTETNAMIDFKALSEAEHQPHIVQLAAALVDCDARKIVSSIDVIVRPDGWAITDETAAMHGITQEKALDCGISEIDAVTMFLQLWFDQKSKIARHRVAHNDGFDARIMRIAMKRHKLGERIMENWEKAESFCTMKAATPICNIPPTAKMVAAGFNKPKQANLGEAYRHFFGVDFDGAHNAMADVNACIAVYFALQDMKAVA
jgi:DNA polymerase-3 subunit epsilon